MPGSRFRRLTAVALAFAVAHMAAAGEIYSTMRNVNAVVEAHGFLLSPAPDIQPTPLPSDLSPAQAFEIVRPPDRPVTIGRLFTSCSCIQVESQKRAFTPGERAILILRNIRPTPPAGQVYAIFVQITSPVRTTLRYDTFVQSGSGPGPEPTASGNAETFEPPEVAPHPRVGGGARTPAVLVDDELDRLGEEPAAEGEAESAAGDEDDSQVIRELTRSAGQSSLDDLPQLAAIPPQIHRTPGTADVLDGMEEDGAPDMTPRLDGEELEGYLAASEANLRLPDGEDVRDSLGGARDDLENLYGREAGDPELAANVDAARQAIDGYSRRDGGADQGTADLAVAVDIDGDIPDFYAHMPPTPVPAAAPAVAEETAAAVTAAIGEPAPGGVPADPALLAETPAVPRSPLAPPPDPAGSPAPQRNPDAPKPVQAVSLITVGVRDMPSSIRFYEALGWRRAAPNKYDQTAFFQLQGQILALYPIHDQLREQNMPEAAPAPGGITLALHVNDKADVWSVYQRFVDAGGTSLRAPVEMASGAVTSYVADPDGNPWEISYVPQFRIDEEGGLWLP